MPLRAFVVKQRSKARYHHIAPRIEWAQKVLRYQQRGDFHLIDDRYRVDDEVLQLMALPSSYEHFLAPIKGLIFNTRVEFDQAMSGLLAKEVYQQHQQHQQEWRYLAANPAPLMKSSVETLMKVAYRNLILKIVVAY